MNRYKYNKPSGATADTLCQKCLKKGHYSFECTAAQQDRPYVSRPSRTQQFLNPKLAPKITEAPPKATSSAQPEKPTSESAKRKRPANESEDVPRKRSRSVSPSSSDSVSSISTNRSRSPSDSPPARQRYDSSDRRRRLSNRSPGFEDDLPKDNYRKSPKSTRERNAGVRNRSRSRSRSPSPWRSPVRRGSRSRSPYRRRDSDVDRQKHADYRSKIARSDGRSRKERSLSPYSKRVALTQAKE